MMAALNQGLNQSLSVRVEECVRREMSNLAAGVGAVVAPAVRAAIAQTPVQQVLHCKSCIKLPTIIPSEYREADHMTVAIAAYSVATHSRKHSFEVYTHSLVMLMPPLSTRTPPLHTQLLRLVSIHWSQSCVLLVLSLQHHLTRRNDVAMWSGLTSQNLRQAHPVALPAQSVAVDSQGVADRLQAGLSAPLTAAVHAAVKRHLLPPVEAAIREGLRQVRHSRQPLHCTLTSMQTQSLQSLLIFLLVSWHDLTVARHVKTPSMV